MDVCTCACKRVLDVHLGMAQKRCYLVSLDEASLSKKKDLYC